MAKILIVYYYREYPPRANLYDNIYAFQRYSRHHCFYLNVFWRRFPWYLRQIDFDLIVFHKTLLGFRFHPLAFLKVLRRLAPLKRFPGRKIAFPQDEYIYTSILCDFINEFGIDQVFSVAPETEWPKIYPTVDFDRVAFHQVLTGYLDETTLQTIDRLGRVTPRDLDLGYRANPAFFLGRFGLFKSRIAEVFRNEAEAAGLTTDILVSNRFKDFFWGDAWYEFMLRCKYTIGVEGGASLLDPEGEHREAIARYLSQHPDAAFDEVEAHCFPGQDGALDLRALSPRHLEACATRTCQILVAGDYNGILQPEMHYLELKQDFSNLAEIVAAIKSDTRWQKLTERAYQDIVASGRYTYRSFVEAVSEKLDLPEPAPPLTSRERLICRWMAAADKLSWRKAAAYTRMKNLLPDAALVRLQRLRHALQG